VVRIEIRRGRTYPILIFYVGSKRIVRNLGGNHRKSNSLITRMRRMFQAALGLDYRTATKYAHVLFKLWKAHAFAFPFSIEMSVPAPEAPAPARGAGREVGGMGRKNTHIRVSEETKRLLKRVKGEMMREYERELSDDDVIRILIKHWLRDEGHA